jgi:hypothetical protein
MQFEVEAIQSVGVPEWVDISGLRQNEVSTAPDELLAKR